VQWQNVKQIDREGLIQAATAKQWMAEQASHLAPAAAAARAAKGS
jgi:hypothetical protein